MKNNIFYLLLITFCCSCSHSNPNAAAYSNKTEDTIVSPAPQIMTRDFRKEVITALYMMGCNDRLEMGLPDKYEEDPWKMKFTRDSLLLEPDYFERIEYNLAKDPFGPYLLDSLKRWLFLEQMLLFPQDCDLDLFEYGITDEMPQTHHLLDKYINRDIQGIESLSTTQLDCYCSDVINYLFTLSCEEQLKYIIDYYTYIRDHPIDRD